MSEANFGTGWETSRAAGALLAAIGTNDQSALASAVSRVRRFAGKKCVTDGWTEERAELLGALATETENGGLNAAGLRLLRHLSNYPAAGFSGRVM